MLALKDTLFSPALWRRRTDRLKFVLQSWTVLTLGVMVVLPSLIAAVYFSFVATPQFETEARFAVRTAQLSSDRPRAAVNLPAAADGQTPEQFMDSGLNEGDLARDAFMVANYIRSRNIASALDADGYLRKIYSRRGIDRFSRFEPDGKLEDLWEYWKGKARASVDTISGVITLRVQAFSRDESFQLAGMVIRQTEEMLNRYSDRIRLDALKAAEQELAKTEGEYRSALVALRDLRDTDKIINPQDDISATAKALLRLQLERTTIERERTVASEALSMDAPSVRIMTSRIQAIDAQIAALQNELTNQSSNLKAASKRIGEFEELELRKQFSAKMLQIVQSAFQRARLRAQQQEVYLVVFSPPTMPEAAKYPRILVNTFLVFICSLILWALLRLVVAGIKDQAM